MVQSHSATNHRQVLLMACLSLLLTGFSSGQVQSSSTDLLFPGPVFEMDPGPCHIAIGDS